MNNVRDAITCEAKAIISSLLGLQSLLRQKPTDQDFLHLIDLQLDALEPLILGLEQRQANLNRAEMIACLLNVSDASTEKGLEG